MSKYIVITRPLPGDAEKALRQEGFENIWCNPENRKMRPEELREKVAGAHAILTTPVDIVDDELLDCIGFQLVIVSNYAVGYDNIDIAACKERGVIVGHTPNAVTEPTADIAWLLLLAAAKRVTEGTNLIRSGAWKGVQPDQLLGMRVVGKTLLIIGAGRIGFATARRAVGWEMNILYHSRSQHEEFECEPVYAQRVGLEEGLAKADFVSLHTPSTKETKHLINAERLKLMKSTAILVNAARGAVIDEKALAKALREGVIAAAGLDVYEYEPEVNPELLKLDNVFLLPHLGSATVEDREWMMRIAVENITAALSGNTPPHIVS